jgi:hypothetical protein
MRYNTGSGSILEDGMTDERDNQGYTDEGPATDDGDDPGSDAYWISRARHSYEDSKTWFDVSVRRRMEDNMRLFNSQHPRGSRYQDSAYKSRSNLFRPKTRSSVRKLEAATAAAFFATQDALTATAPNPRDKMQRLGADAQAELLNYRLQNQIPWFLTCLGGVQDAAKQGVVISKQVWTYREIEETYEEDVLDSMTNERIGSRRTYDTRVVADHPDIILRPVENILFSPAADWRNPVQTSPFLIDMEPFFVGDITQRAEDGPKGEYDVAWRKLDKTTIRSALKQSYDPVRQAREGHREDRYEDGTTAIQDHDVVWVHHNYMRVDGQEWYYATLGTEIMLSEVVPLEEVTPLKERPYVMGIIAIETHKPYPAGHVELGRPLQEEINDLANLRVDNIRHIISPRYFVKRGTSVDIRSLLRNVAGGVTAMENPKDDVNIRQIADTTSSAFQEQDRLSIEMDDLVGGFSQSSVASNHNITERVGNTQMLGESANQLTEMAIRTLSETWVEPVLQQINDLERALESDEVVLAIIGQRMNLSPEVVFRMLDLPVRVTVNVGFGATNPQKRLQKVVMAFGALAQINPKWIERADQGEVTTEILGAVGFKSAERFFPDLASGAEQEDPRITQLQQEVEELQQALQADQPKYDAMKEIKQMEIQSREGSEQRKMAQEQQKEMTAQELAHLIEQHKWQGMMLDHQISKEQNQFRKQELMQQRRALNHTIAMDERQFQLAQQKQEYEISVGAEETPQSMNTEATSVSKPDTKPEGGRIASSPKVKGDDKTGVIARDNYGKTPFREG